MLTCLGLKILRWMVAYYIQKQCRKARLLKFQTLTKYIILLMRNIKSLP
jgi:hypothetical protein